MSSVFCRIFFFPPIRRTHWSSIPKSIIRAPLPVMQNAVFKNFLSFPGVKSRMESFTTARLWDFSPLPVPFLPPRLSVDKRVAIPYNLFVNLYIIYRFPDRSTFCTLCGSPCHSVRQGGLLFGKCHTIAGHLNPSKEMKLWIILMKRGRALKKAPG